MIPAFHLAYPVSDLKLAQTFFVETLGASLGRQSERWVDLNFFGHQISLHLSDDPDLNCSHNSVDGDNVPTLHFGCVLPWEEWTFHYERLVKRGAQFIIDKKIRFEGKTGEQGTYFVRGPCGLSLEFKSFKDPNQLFATDQEKPCSGSARTTSMP